MERSRGRRAATIAALAAAAVAAACAIAARDILRERWWIWRLGSGDLETVQAAAERLGELRSRRAIPALVELFKRKEGNGESVRSAAKALLRIGPEAVAEALAGDGGRLWIEAIASSDLHREAAPLLLSCLEDPRPEVGVGGIRGLLDLESSSGATDLLPPSRILRPVLVDGIRSDDRFLRRTCIGCLAEVSLRGRRFAATILAGALRDPDPELRQTAVEALSGNLDPRSIPPLGIALDDPVPAIRLEALKALSNFAAEDDAAGWEPIVPRLFPFIEGSGVDLSWSSDPPDPDEIRASVFQRIETLGPAGAAAAPALAGFLRAGAPMPAMDILRILGGMGPGAKAAIPSVAAVAGDPTRDSRLRLSAAMALARIAPGDPRPLDMFLELHGDLIDQNFEVDLAAIGPLARRRPDVLAALERLLEEGNLGVRFQAVRALGEAGPAARSAIPAIDTYLDLGWIAVLRVEALQAIWRITGEASEILPLLEDALEGTRMAPLIEVAGLLAEMGPAAAPAVTALANALTPGLSREGSRAILAALGAIGPGAASAAPALIEGLAEPGLCDAAAEALARIGPAAAPDLARALRSEKDWVRYGAARALAGMGAGARPALEALAAAAREDDDDDVRALAAKAVAAIGGNGPGGR